MLCRFTKVQGAHIVALDGELGKVWDVYLDDVDWEVRYLVVDTGGWFSDHKVLISPQAVELTDRTWRTISVCLTRERIQRAPDIDTDKPVSRQHETELRRYYGYPTYWPQHPLSGGIPMPPPASPITPDLLELGERRVADSSPVAETHLRSMREICGYGVSAADGDVGVVRDFLFDDETWRVRYLVVDTGTWLFGKRVLLRQETIQQVDWASRSVAVSPTRSQIEHGCRFDPDHLPLGDLASLLGHATHRGPSPRGSMDGRPFQQED